MFPPYQDLIVAACSNFTVPLSVASDWCSSLCCSIQTRALVVSREQGRRLGNVTKRKNKNIEMKLDLAVVHYNKKPPCWSWQKALSNPKNYIPVNDTTSTCYV